MTPDLDDLWVNRYEQVVDTPLSKDFRVLLDEAKRLLELKAEIGRLPASRLKSSMIRSIDVWFDVENGQSACNSDDQHGEDSLT